MVLVAVGIALGVCVSDGCGVYVLVGFIVLVGIGVFVGVGVAGAPEEIQLNKRPTDIPNMRKWIIFNITRFSGPPSGFAKAGSPQMLSLPVKISPSPPQSVPLTQASLSNDE
jgi:hypothetical protein